MDQHHERILRRLKFVNKLRFLVYLYWLKLRECSQFFNSTRGRYHWIGPRRRPRRRERFFIPAIYFVGMFFLTGEEFAIWSMYVGGVASIFLMLRTAYSFIPQKRYHWLRGKK